MDGGRKIFTLECYTTDIYVKEHDGSTALSGPPDQGCPFWVFRHIRVVARVKACSTDHDRTKNCLGLFRVYTKFRNISYPWINISEYILTLSAECWASWTSSPYPTLGSLVVDVKVRLRRFLCHPLIGNPIYYKSLLIRSNIYDRTCIRQRVNLYGVGRGRRRGVRRRRLGMGIWRGSHNLYHKLKDNRRVGEEIPDKSLI